MALITAGSLVGQISGRVGSVVYSRNRGGAYARNGTIPVTVTTLYAMNAKARLTELSQDWADLTIAQQQAWKTWATQNPITNRLGHQSTLPAHAAYIQCNARLLLSGSAKIELPPIIAAPTPLLTLTPTVDVGAGDVELAYTTTPAPAGVMIWLKAALVDHAGIQHIQNRLKFLCVSAAAAESPLNFETELGLRFGSPQVGQYCWVEAHNFDTATGLISAPLRTGVAVTTT